jgi:DNA-directed RNA polymerase
LCISIASNWAGDAGRSDGAKTDKIPLNDRVYWTLDNEEIILSYAVNPKVNQGWMSADKPWQFLAACNELLKVRKWEKDGNVLYDYCSHLECFIDGSNNGSQHLTALTRDEVTAPHVNLVPLDLPGDLYKYVADHVWTDIANEVSLLSSAKKTEYDSVIDTLIDIKGQIAVAPMKSDRRKELIDEVIQYKKEHEKQVKACSPAYWIRITDSKHKRKIVKRGVMTLPYGASAYGLGQQVIDDARRHGIAQLMTMEHAWGSYLGRAILSNCKGSLKRPTQLLSIFENAGRVAESEGEFLKWTVPVTNFPVIQHYVEGKVKKINVQYGPAIGERNQSTGYFSNNYQLSVTHPEIPIASRRKQSQGAAPNAIHSLDAAHLTMAVCAADYNVTTIHDSFGCHLGRMADLFVLIREKFVELYESDPLNSLMKDINGDLSGIEVGALDIKQILESEYAFV